MILEEKTVNTNVNNTSGQGQSRPIGLTPPNMGTFTGKEDWRPYFLQFCHIANDYKWSDQDRLDKLIECAQYLAVYWLPGTSDDFIHIVATDVFFKGCQVKRAALVAMYKDPENLDRAVKFVKSAMTNHRVVV
jgi:hypothetical protein